MNYSSTFLRNIIFAILLSFLFTHCASVPSTETDKELGAEASIQVKEQMGIIKEKQTTNYLESIGDRLVSNLDTNLFEYQFNILDMEVPNAMALPGGYIYFSRGILLLANSEDELAGIMGHEIIHAHNRHSVKAMNKSIFSRILSIPGSVVQVVVSPELGRLINSPFKSIDQLSQSKYSRDNESEADRVGAELAAKSGYDPAALATILNNLSKYQTLETGEDEKFNFFDSHPLTPERVEDINKYSKILKIDKTVKPFAADKNEFLKQLDGILIGSNPANGFFNKNHFIHPDLEFAITFPETWKTLNIPIAAVAYESKGEAQILLSLSEPGSSPEEQAKLFLEKYKESGTVEPRFNEPLMINGQNAYIITFQESSSRQTTVVNLIWIDIGENTLSIITAGYQQHNEKLLKSAMSLQKISDNDIKDLQITVLRLEEGVEGETLKEFSSRTNNALTIEALALINDIKESEVLKKGQLLKIGKREKYKKN